jgi:hypothetical protein
MPSYVEHGGGRRVSARIRRDREVSRVLDRRASDGRMGSSAVTGSCPGRSRIAMGNAGSDHGHPASPRLLSESSAGTPDSTAIVDRPADADAILDGPAPATDLDRVDDRRERSSELLVVVELVGGR